MSKRKNISKQDLKNIDLVLENDVQCSGLNIGGRAYEFVSGGYELLDLGSGQSGTLTDAQLLDLMANDSIIIKIYTTYFRKIGETTTNITYEALTYDTDTTKYVNSVNITKSTKQWKLTLWKLQNQPLTITNINENLTIGVSKASVINGVLYVNVTANVVGTISGGDILFNIGNVGFTENKRFIFTYATKKGYMEPNGNLKTSDQLAANEYLDMSLAIIIA